MTTTLGISSASLIAANLFLLAVVLVPLLLVGAAILGEAVARFRRRRNIVWVELKGVGRIPVLKD